MHLIVCFSRWQFCLCELPLLGLMCCWLLVQAAGVVVFASIHNCCQGRSEFVQDTHGIGALAGPVPWEPAWLEVTTSSLHTMYTHLPQHDMQPWID
jgi:hypothetical protein